MTESASSAPLCPLCVEYSLLTAPTMVCEADEYACNRCGHRQPVEDTTRRAVEFTATEWRTVHAALDAAADAAAEEESMDDAATAARLAAMTWSYGVVGETPDVVSSASRQHYIDTGRYLPDVDDERDHAETEPGQPGHDESYARKRDAEDLADATPVVHVAAYEHPSDYEDNAPIIRVGATRAAVLAALARDVDEFLSEFPTEDDPHSDEDMLAQAHADAGPLPADTDEVALAAWLGAATANGGAYTLTTETVQGA